MFALDPLPHLLLFDSINIDDEMFIGVLCDFTLNLAQVCIIRNAALCIWITNIDLHSTLLHQRTQNIALCLTFARDHQWLFSEVVPAQFLYEEFFKLKGCEVSFDALNVRYHNFVVSSLEIAQTAFAFHAGVNVVCL